MAVQLAGKRGLGPVLAYRGAAHGQPAAGPLLLPGVAQRVRELGRQSRDRNALPDRRAGGLDAGCGQIIQALEQGFHV